MSQSTDVKTSRLLELMRDGNALAFKENYLYYFPILIKSAFRKIQDENIVEEIVQDIFIDLWRKKHEINPSMEIGAYLNALLRNKVLHEWRKQYTRSKHIELFRQLNKGELTDETFFDQFDANELQKRLNSAISTLSPQCRQAFELSRYEHLSYREIGERMTISVKTVEKHIGKALKILKIEFKEHYIMVIILCGLWLS